MVLGMSLATYTLIHVIISLVGIVSGLIVLFGMLGNKRLDGMTAVFLITTALTSITGFGFPFKGVTPGIVLGILSIAVLALSIPARYMFHMSGKWRSIYVISAVVALYFNCFVLVVQTFQKEILHTTQPPSGPAFAVTQGIVLALFTVWGYLAVKKFHPLAKSAASTV